MREELFFFLNYSMFLLTFLFLAVFQRKRNKKLLDIVSVSSQNTIFLKNLKIQMALEYNTTQYWNKFQVSEMQSMPKKKMIYGCFTVEACELNTPSLPPRLPPLPLRSWHDFNQPRNIIWRVNDASKR